MVNNQSFLLMEYNNWTLSVKSAELSVVLVSPNRITLKWESPIYTKCSSSGRESTIQATDITFVVMYAEFGSIRTLHKAIEKKDIYMFSITGLKAATQYAFFVVGYDAYGNLIRYPGYSGVKTAATLCTDGTALDVEAPKVSDLRLQFTNITTSSFTARWEKAIDNKTVAKNIVYSVYIREIYDPKNMWQPVVSLIKDLGEYTFTGLKPNTWYTVLVEAIDEMGNKLHYTVGDSTANVKTKSDRIDEFPFTLVQNARVLKGADTIKVQLVFDLFEYDSAGKVVGRSQYTWDSHYLNNGSSTTTFRAPDNMVFNDTATTGIYTRKAATPGVNRWKPSYEGSAEIKEDGLKIELTGSYFNNSVKFTQIP